MRGLGGITETIDRILSIAGVELAAWVAPLGLLIVFVGVLPWIRANYRAQQIRERIRRLTSEETVDRHALTAEIFRIAGRHKDALILIAEEGSRRGHLGLSMAAVKKLSQSPIHTNEARRLHSRLHQKPPRHIEGELAAIETLLDEGMKGAARLRAVEAIKQWPDHPFLTTLTESQEE